MRTLVGVQLTLVCSELHNCKVIFFKDGSSIVVQSESED